MFEEYDSIDDLPPGPWLVRRRGRPVAAYQQSEQAEQHAATDDELTVTWDIAGGHLPGLIGLRFATDTSPGA